jgi:hypothetical protein
MSASLLLLRLSVCASLLVLWHALVDESVEEVYELEEAYECLWHALVDESVAEVSELATRMRFSLLVRNSPMPCFSSGELRVCEVYASLA